MRFDKWIVCFLFVLAGCQGIADRQENVYLTIIASGDKIYYYENKLDSKEKIDSTAITEKNLDDIIEKAQAKANSQLYITVKFSDRGNSAQSFSTITDILKKKNIQFSKDPVISKKETEYLGLHSMPFFGDSKPQTMKLFLSKGDITEEEKKNAIIILLSGSDDLIAYVQPHISDALKLNTKTIDQYLSVAKKKDSNLVVIIKASTKAPYKSVVDMLDKMTTNNIKKYLLEDPTKAEENFLNSL